MRALLLSVMLAFAFVPLVGAQSESSPTPPQQDWMVHMDGSGGSWKYIPDRIVVVPGGTVQLMVFGNGQFSLTLDEPGYDADISSTAGTIRVAEFRAPPKPGEYPFHDKYHPEARGVLLVQPAEEPAVVGVIPGGYEARFAPETLEVNPGQEVRFRANGSFGHNLRHVDGLFDAGDLAPGQEGSFRAPTAPGEYPFECRFHVGQGMVGTLVVRAASATTTPTQPTPPTQSATPTGGSSATPAGSPSPEEPAQTPLTPVLALVALAAALLVARRR